MNHESAHFLFNRELPVKTIDDKTTRRILGHNDQAMMVSVAFETGGTGAVHSHPHTQVTYVASGRFEVTIGDEMRTLAAGDGFYAPPDVPHGVLCLEKGTLVDVFAPTREDFLK